MTPDPIEEAVARAIHKARYDDIKWQGKPETWGRWDREYAFRLARAAIAAHLAALEAAGFVVVSKEPSQFIAPAGLDPDEIRRILTNGR